MLRYNLGVIAEYIIALLYILKFYKILHMRYKTHVGEIDLIAVRNNQIVFIEVKARKLGIYEDIVSITQRQRISRTAELFIARNLKYANYDLRFDLAVVTPYRFPLIIQNAW